MTFRSVETLLSTSLPMFLIKIVAQVLYELLKIKNNIIIASIFEMISHVIVLTKI